MLDLEKILWMREWDETEYEDSGWGMSVRGDGISLHLCTSDAKKYGQKYRFSGSVLESEPCKKISPIYVDEKLYEKVKAQELGYRLEQREIGELHDSIIRLAEAYATYYHKGQKREGTKKGYIIHPKRIVEKLRQLDVTDYSVLCAAWLHDTVEDTELTIGQIEAVFGRQIAKYVSMLTKGKDYEKYMEKKSTGPREVIMINLCDVLDNLSELEHLSRERIEKNLARIKQYHLPKAQEISPKIAIEMNYYIGKLEVILESKKK